MFTRQIKAQIGKSTLTVLFIKKKMPTLAGNKQFYVHSSFYGTRLFHLSTEKYGSDPSEMDIKVVIPAPTQ